VNPASDLGLSFLGVFGSRWVALLVGDKLVPAEGVDPANDLGPAAKASGVEGANFCFSLHSGCETVCGLAQG
jgi:hypothetical protein